MIGENIKRLRLEKKMTQEQLAGEFNLSQRAIANWESEVNEPGIARIVKLAEIFGVTVSELIGVEPVHQNSISYTMKFIEEAVKEKQLREIK